MEWEFRTCVGIGVRQCNGYGSTDKRKGEYKRASKFEVHLCYIVEPLKLEEWKMRWRKRTSDQGGCVCIDNCAVDHPGICIRDSSNIRDFYRGSAS